jgi:hypothetical protein
MVPDSYLIHPEIRKKQGAYGWISTIWQKVSYIQITFCRFIRKAQSFLYLCRTKTKNNPSALRQAQGPMKTKTKTDNRK